MVVHTRRVEIKKNNIGKARVKKEVPMNLLSSDPLEKLSPSLPMRR
jgi:hypothetical protein